MWVSLRGGTLEIHMDGQEQEWVQCLASTPPAKTRLKPYLGDEAESLEALRLHVSGRTARLRQAGLDDVALRRAVQREIPVLALHGYICLLYTSPSPRDKRQSRMPSSA